MMKKWSSAAFYLKIISIFGVVWCVVFASFGIPLLLTQGPGLPILLLGLVGLSPGVAIFARSSDS